MSRPLSAQLSVLSVPPREKRVQRQRAKAQKSGLPLSDTQPHPTNALTPTLASTRSRRAVQEVGYKKDKQGNLYVHHVNRKPVRSEPAPAIPYLAGQEDIPRSDDESGDDTDIPMRDPANNDVSNSFDAEETSTEPDLVDYDAEGEDEDDVMEGYKDIALTNFGLNKPSEPGHPFSSSVIDSEASHLAYQPLDLLCNASAEDIHALFGGLDSLPSGDERYNYHVRSVTPFDGFMGQNNARGGYITQTPFAMHQMNAAVDDIAQPHGNLAPKSHTPSLTPRHLPSGSHTPHSYPWLPSPPRATPPLQPPSLPVTPRHEPAVLVQPVPPLRPHACYPPPIASGSGSRSGSSLVNRRQSPALPYRQTFSRPSSRLSTRELVSQVRAQPRAPYSPPMPPPVGTPAPPRPDSPRPINPTPLRESLDLPDFLRGMDDNSQAEDELLSNSDPSRPSTPITFEDTDIGLTNSLFPHERAVLAHSHACRWPNIHIQEQPVESRRIPTYLELESKARALYRRCRHRSRSGRATTESTRNRNRMLASALTPDQQEAMPPMEYHVLKQILFTNPWPEDQASYLRAAQSYATTMIEISSESEVFTKMFNSTVLYRTSGNRGNSLTKIAFMMEHAFKVSSADKNTLYQLMFKDTYLFRTLDRNPKDYFCVGAIGDALEILLFKSSKLIGVAFMSELCQPDDPEKCARWHQKLTDRTAHRGVPPALIAFAATQMYWALEKMYVGTSLSFDEQRYRGIWDRYHRALLKLPHLGQLRVDLLNRLKNYYMDHYPTEEQDVHSGEDAHAYFPAW